MMSSQITSQDAYHQFYAQSKDQTEAYWKQVSKNYTWQKEPTKICSGDFANVNVKWFEDGILNITENALDRHLKTKADQVAIEFEPNDPKDNKVSYTYKEVYEHVCQTAELLSRKGVHKGDVVCLYMSMIPELLFSVLACARIGAVHSVVFGGFSAKALRDRIEDCNAKLIVTNDSGYRGTKLVPIKKTVDDALEPLKTKPQVMIWQHSKEDISFYEDRDFYAFENLDHSLTSFPAEPMNAEDPLFILYTSGSTGKPKGLLHTTAGYMVWSSETFKHVFQVKSSQDVFWCTADIGWITGHSYISYAPLINGVTQVMFEGVPTWPSPSRFWDIVDKYKVTHFYTAPTAVRALQACEKNCYEHHDLSSLKVLGSVGEPINEEAWEWYKKEIGKNKCPIVDTWWQTETGGIMISNLAGVTQEKATYATTPLPGVVPEILDAGSKPVFGDQAEGHLCISKPWPGMARSIYGDHQRFVDTYFTTHKGYYFTGDGARREPENCYRIIGRVDDVVNVSGHRVGTAEVEDVISEVEGITESAVIGAPHPIKGQALVAFTIGESKGDETLQLLQKANEHITKELGALCKLEKLVFVPGLPKTRSGKIMRRILRKIAHGESEFGDTSTLINPEVVSQILENYL